MLALLCLLLSTVTQLPVNDFFFPKATCRSLLEVSREPQSPQGAQTLPVRLVGDAEFGPNCWGLLPPCRSTAAGPHQCLRASPLPLGR